MTPEELWRRKSDGDVEAAMGRLTEYSEAGRAVIVAEYEHRREAGFLPALATERGDEEPPSPSSSETGGSVKGSLLGRAWRGEVSLPVIYWVWGLLGNAALALLVEKLFALTESLAVAVLGSIAGLLYAVFVVVGIWRSAGRYRGRRIWADLARVGLALGLLRAIARVLFVQA